MEDCLTLAKKLQQLAEYRFNKSGVLQWRDSPQQVWRELSHFDRRMFMQIVNVREWSRLQQALAWIADQRRSF
ncbi:hypothetical protein [Pantoea sp. paga]|uniref:hypothetical protein n=1 Tax=Pantoea sp. paga TaxID=2597519 RepID=UPI001181665F|nr:hypothetical protein [Pantoea sp. paga]TSH77921.1 hypothetical protein FOV68_23575 [Pantoea sp. paga]